jgi:quinoprotein glucose dehydrogenase
MRIRILIFTLVAAAAFTLSRLPVAASQETTTTAGATTTAPSAKTTWDGIFSQAQATKGETVYVDKCQKCHGANGGGADAPPLVGADFASDWDGLSLYQLFDRTKSSMPQDDPGSMSREDTAAVTAYMLQKNGFPAGEMDLPSSADALNAMKYKATK